MHDALERTNVPTIDGHHETDARRTVQNAGACDGEEITTTIVVLSLTAVNDDVSSLATCALDDASSLAILPAATHVRWLYDADAPASTQPIVLRPVISAAIE